jgi:hypothetical protein
MMRAFSTPLLAALTLAVVVSPAVAAPAAKHAAGAAAPSAAAPGGAGAASVDSDLRCLLTMAVLGQDKTKQQIAQMGATFFVGRISVRAPNLDLASAVKAEEAKLSPKDLPAEAQRCGPLVQNALGSLQKSFSQSGGGQPAPGTAPAPAPAPAPTAPAAPPPAPK